MILDKQLLVSDAQVITGTSTLYSTNAIDTWNNVALESSALPVPPLAKTGLGIAGTNFLGGQIHDTGRGDSVNVWAQIVVDLAGGTSLTVSYGYATANDGTGFAAVMTSPSVALAAALAGYQFKLGSLPAAKSHNRYLMAAYNLTGTFSGTGAITAGVILDRQTAVNVFV